MELTPCPVAWSFLMIRASKHLDSRKILKSFQLLGALPSCKHFSLWSTSFRSICSLIPLCHCKTNQLVMNLAIFGKCCQVLPHLQIQHKIANRAAFVLGNFPFLVLPLSLVCCFLSSLFLLLFVAETSTTLDFWKGASDAGCSARWEKEEDKKIQGVSLEMHVFSFSRNSGFVCYLWWALVW